MVKKTNISAKRLAQQPGLFPIALAGVIIASMLAYSIFIMNEALYTFMNIPQKPLIVMLEWAKVASALLPVIVGLVVFLTAQGGKLRRLVVVAVYIGIYWLAKSIFAAFVPTFAIGSSIFGEEFYRNSGINFFLEYAFGALVALVIYFVTKKQTMKLNWLTVYFLVLSTILLLVGTLGYFLR